MSPADKGRTTVRPSGLKQLVEKHGFVVSENGGSQETPAQIDAALRLALAQCDIKATTDDEAAAQLHEFEPLEQAQTQAPSSCYVPDGFNAKMWGPFVRLSTLVSGRNWGVGDFTDLAELCRATAARGAAGVVALTPLQPVLSKSGSEQSLRLFSSLSFIDPIYIDVEAAPGYGDADETKRNVLAPEFQQNLKQIREAPELILEEARGLKLTVLGLLYQRFRHEDLRTGSSRAQEFRGFIAERGDNLKYFAIHQALADNCKESIWRKWPEQYQDSNSDAVKEFVRSNLERVEFYQYLQWLADCQLKAVGQLCHSLSMPLGLCCTAPNTIDPDGYETWRHRELFAAAVVADNVDAAGALSRLHDQAAVIPWRLRQSGYSIFADSVRAAARHAGAVFLGNILSWTDKQWLLPNGDRTVSVRYPLGEILDLMRRESQHAKCLLIAGGFDELRSEDLSTIAGAANKAPDKKRTQSSSRGTKAKSAAVGETTPERIAKERMASAQAAWDGLGILPALPALPYHTHSGAMEQTPSSPYAVLPFLGTGKSTLSYWMGADLQQRDLSEDDKSMRDSAVATRMLERVEILRALEELSLLPDTTIVDPASTSILTIGLSAALYELMARGPASILFVVLEDLAATPVIETRVAPYRALSKLALDINELFKQKAVIDLIASLKRNGRTADSNRTQESESGQITAIIPAATYRLQLHKEFTLERSQDLISYLDAMGISHLYFSPILTARAGSMHGYDIINHKLLNQEIGTDADLDRLVAALKSKKMGIVLDMVPNHMGIGKENLWWMDVLENGPASQFAEYFDIDWTPIKSELSGKVTLPVLGEFYGDTLQAGLITLRFNPDGGTLHIRYYDHEFPLNPITYPLVLSQRLELLNERLGAENLDVMEYQSIITALSRLPGHMERGGSGERIREKRLQMKRLADVCKRNPAITEFIEQNLKSFEVHGNDRSALQRIHTLLEAQAYRLVHWRVANDEINYRRFFDINDLAAVRTEDPRVFEEMHGLLLKWVEERKIEGIRIDHPDGLYDPAAYFALLQQRALEKLGGNTVSGLSDPADSNQKTALPFYVVAEKILAPFERLEEDWQVQGTTGYDFLNEVLNILVRSESEEAFSHIYQNVLGESFDYDELKADCKRIILDGVLASELNVMAHRLSQIAESSWYFRDFTLNSLRFALRQVLIEFPVYRTYATAEKVDKSTKQFIDWAIGKAKRRGQASNPAVYDFIRSVLTLEAVSDPRVQAGAQEEEFRQAIESFAMKFQQFSGPVMAKSCEDTLFYRYVRFACLNEVGGEPDKFGGTVSGLHQKNGQRQKQHPYSMLTTSTHDTKRAEDVRARLAVLSELPNIWAQRLAYWTRMNKSKKASIDEEPAPDANDEYLLYQTIIGASPLSLSEEPAVIDFRERIQAYMLKSAREAKRLTSWTNQNQEYETALTNFVERILTRSATNPFLDDLVQFQSVLSPLGFINSLAQTTLKLTSPGVPDIYQGSELWDFSLVDPDNRRPVDYGKRRRLYGELEPFLNYTDSDSGKRSDFVDTLAQSMDDGRVKMYILACLLRLRRNKAGLFTDGKYVPLEVTGKHSSHAFAFYRESNDQKVVVVVPRLVATLLNLDSEEKFKPDRFCDRLKGDIWEDTALTIPSGINESLTDLFTSQNIKADNGQLLISKLFRHLPVSVLLAS